ASEMWIERIAPASAAIISHTPSAPKMRRLALPSAVVRSSKLGWAELPKGTLSTSSVRTPASPRASARLAPTNPPPTLAASPSRPAQSAAALMVRAALAAPHQRLDLLGVLGRARGKHLGAAARHHHVILDADADVAEAPRHAAPGRQVDARLDRHRHARLE